MTDHQDSVAYQEEETFAINIEWSGQHRGYQNAGADALQRVQDNSQRAINLAMGTIRAMAYRVSKTMGKLEDSVRPNEAEIEFGINLDAEAGALLARASTGAQITVKLKWAIDQPQRTQVLVRE